MNKTIRCGLLLTAVTLSCTAGFGQQPTLFTNNYDPKAEIPKLDAEKSVIYDPVRTWTYSHHPSVAFFKGTFYAVFSNGPEGEDECGQRIMLATSEDFTDWSEPRVILSPGEGEFGQTKILTPGGITVIGGKLTLYYTENDNDGVSNKRIKATLFAITSEDGRTWSEPVNLDPRIPVPPAADALQRPDHPHGQHAGLLHRRSLRHRQMEPLPDGGSQISGRGVTFEQVHPSLCEGALFEHERSGFLYSRGRAKPMTATCGKCRVPTAEFQDVARKKPLYGQQHQIVFRQSARRTLFLRRNPGHFPSGERYPLVLALSEDGYNFGKTFILSDDRYTQR
ncbi:MAG: glycosyl hydrolase family 32 [Alistipes onderdonkii]